MLNLLQRNYGLEVHSDHVPSVENICTDDCSRRWLKQVTTEFGDILTVERPSVRETLLYLKTHLPKYRGCFTYFIFLYQGTQPFCFLILF